MSKIITIVGQNTVEVGDIRDYHTGCGWYNLELTFSDGSIYVAKGFGPAYRDASLIGRKIYRDGKSVMTQVSLLVPIENGALCLGNGESYAEFNRLPTYLW